MYREQKSKSINSMTSGEKYDSILKNLGNKIENIAQITKDNQKFDISILEQIDHLNSTQNSLSSNSKVIFSPGID